MATAASLRTLVRQQNGDDFPLRFMVNEPSSLLGFSPHAKKSVKQQKEQKRTKKNKKEQGRRRKNKNEKERRSKKMKEKKRKREKRKRKKGRKRKEEGRREPDDNYHETISICLVLSIFFLNAILSGRPNVRGK